MIYSSQGFMSGNDKVRGYCRRACVVGIGVGFFLARLPCLPFLQGHALSLIVS